MISGAKTKYWAACDHAPPGSYYELEKGVIIASPELSFVQMAPGRTMYRRLSLAYELCGYYSTVRQVGETGRSSKLGNAQVGYQKGGESIARPYRSGLTALDTPLSSREKIALYIESLPATKGKALAKACLPWLCDHSRSPMESNLAISMCLPPRYGGFGIPEPIMNEPIKLKGTMAGIAQREQVVCDLYWPQFKLALEYDSNQYHEGNTQYARDLGKIAALENNGIRVVTITTAIFNELFAFERYMKGIRSYIGLPPIRETDKKLEKRTELFKEIRATRWSR